VVALLKRWWQQPSHYDWLSGYLHARGMSAPTRTMMASIAGSLALCLIALLFSADGPQGIIPTAMTWVAFAGGVIGTILWTTRWPTRRQSVAFAVITNTSIALACLAYPTPLASVLGCIAFATSGGFIAFFHTSKFVFYNFAVAAGVATFEATRLAGSGHPALAAVDLFLVLQVNIALPLAIQVMVRALGDDLARADHDPLTGLLNRRAFQHKALGLLLARPAPDMYLLVVVIDLDNFKAVNDLYGHSAGDEALIEVAKAIRSSTRETAITTRSGGEEFIVADTSYGNDAGPLAKRICDAIAELPSPVTASVGTACAALHSARESNYQAIIDDLVCAADQAMYHAKRFGGNRFHHHGPVP
jgi:diguanylate cyclase (GGDEF)-like protein